MNQIKHQFEMSSSSAPRRSSSATSYTAGFLGSQVTLTIGNDGNRSLTLSRGQNSKTSSSVPVPVPVAERRFPDGWVGPADTPFCKVCYDAGLRAPDYTNHFVKDQPGPSGKVVCPTLLAQKCLTCGLAGHTSSYCPETLRAERERLDREREQRERNKKSVARGDSWETVGKSSSASSSRPRPRIEDMDASKTLNSKKSTPTPTAAPVRKTDGGSFGILAVDDSSSDDEIQTIPAGVPKPVIPERPILTGPPPAVEPEKPLTWAQRAAAAASKPAPPSSQRVVSSSSSSSDTRFQLHELCKEIEPSKRAVSKRPGPPASAESSMRRKQDSVTVPA